MKRLYPILMAAILAAALAVTLVQATVIRDAIWCDGDLFGVTITPKDVPNKGPFDVIYNFNHDEAVLEGQRSISDAKPGDTDYNGGRWEVVLVTHTEAGVAEFDPDGDGEVNYELVSDSELHAAEDAGYITTSDPVRYFVCPLHPQNND